MHCFYLELGIFTDFCKDAIKHQKFLYHFNKKGAGSMSEIELADHIIPLIITYQNLSKLDESSAYDQLESKLSKKLVKRGVTELVTPE